MAEGSAKTARNSKLVDHSKTGQQKPFRENTRKTESETGKYIRGIEFEAGNREQIYSVGKTGFLGNREQITIVLGNWFPRKPRTDHYSVGKLVS